MFKAEKKGALTGYVILRETKKRGFNSGVIVDLFAGPQDLQTIGALLDSSIAYFVGQKVDFIEYRGLLNQRSIVRLLRRKGFFFKVYLTDLLVFAKDKDLLSTMLDYPRWFMAAYEPDIDFA